MTKRPIDNLREAAGSLEIADPSDPSAISEMFSIGDEHLYVVKDNGVYEILLADAIDPKRTNADIPNSYKKVLNCDVSDESFWRVLMMARELTNHGFLREAIDVNLMIKHLFEPQRRICSISSNIASLKNDEKLCEQVINEQTEASHQGFSLPQIASLEGRVKGTFMELRRCFQHLFNVFSHVFELKKSVVFSEAVKCVSDRYGPDDQFTEFLNGVSTDFEFFRNIRNSIEHPKVDEKLSVQDFHMLPTGKISPPIIEFVFRGRITGPTSAITGLKESRERIITISEVLLAYTLSYQVRDDEKMMKPRLLHYPNGRDNTRRYRYGWAVEFKNGIIPLG